MAEVVENDGFLSAIEEQSGNRSTHVSGSASDQYLHDLFPFLDRFSIKLSLLHRVCTAVCAQAQSRIGGVKSRGDSSPGREF
jgi:hypothetical protein